MDTIASVGRELERLGVRSVFGSCVVSLASAVLPSPPLTSRARLTLAVCARPARSPRSGKFAKPLLSADGKTCVGAVAEDGTQHSADRVVLACGAWTPTLIDLQGQCVSKCWVLGQSLCAPCISAHPSGQRTQLTSAALPPRPRTAHIDLTPEEVDKYRRMPVIYDSQLGFFFEASKDGKMKLCNESVHLALLLLTRPR